MTELRVTRALVRGIRLRCPRCGYGPIFRGWFRMLSSCRDCNFLFEREQGYFVGAIYLNYAATVLIVLLGYFALYARLSLVQQLLVLGGFCVLFPIWFFRYSKSLWLAMDYIFDPGGRPR